MIARPLFLDNEEWYTEEEVVTEDGGEELVYHLTDKAPAEARKSFEEWNAMLKDAKENGYDF